MEPQIRTLVDIADTPATLAGQADIVLERGRWAAEIFQRFDRELTMSIVDAVARAAHENAGRYADWAVEETGFGVAARLARAALEEFAGLARRRDGLERRILDLAPAVRIFGAASERLPNTSCFALPGMTGEIQVMALDLAGGAVSAGSACSSGKIATSHVLEAMGVDKEMAVCAIRVSLGWTNTENDIDTFIRTWTAVRATADAALRAVAAA